MELRHLRYFVGVADERGFARAARRLRVAQPALSKQIRDLEAEVGTALFQRLARGVRLTPAGEAFLVEARDILARAARAVAGARGAAEDGASALQFAHGELAAYTTTIEKLLAAVRDAYADVQVRVTSESDAGTYEALREQRVDVGCVFVAEWPVEGFSGHRLVDCPATGVLLPASHPLAAKPCVRLEELRALAWLHSAPQRWPGFIRTFEAALRDRGLVPRRRYERPKAAPSANMLIAAGEAWALASEAVGAPYRSGSTAIVYRPLVEPPIPCWVALVWLPPASPTVLRLVDVARRQRLTVGDEEPPARIA
jgi:DNA-binding transcriptional LysR family regulator